ncbi:TPA: phage tail protein [Kluyvera ascorbata]|nr:phage tail protein [Kluyvera ascorbata]HED1307168.1 phage tail protein [Kluyvera ascorbata]
MKYVFSAISNAFYPLVLQSIYEAAGTWPSDGVEVEESVYDEFTAEAPAGKTRGVVNGMPAWVDVEQAA